LKKIDHNICFLEERQFFRRKLGKIAENCDHNIDPWSHWSDCHRVFKYLQKKLMVRGLFYRPDRSRAAWQSTKEEEDSTEGQQVSSQKSHT
jgi:hypothetical protein